MKFWQKAFLIILSVFILFINICLLLISKYSFTLNLERDTDRAVSEYYFIMSGTNETMNSMFYRGQAIPSDASLESVMRSYANYYAKQGVYLEFKHDDRTLFTNVPADAVSEVRTVKPDQAAYTVQAVGGSTNYLVIAGNLSGQYQAYALTYLRSLSELYHTHNELTGYLIFVSAAAEGLLALVLFVILKRLTRPIRTLQTATRKIAGGVYDERVDIRGHDEFHDLSENFNQMALSIQDKIKKLDKNAQDKQRLIDNLAHELRTPLTSIRGYAEYLQHANTSEQNRIDAAGYIISQADRMKNLAFKLLDLALVTNNKPDFQEIAPLASFLNQVKELSQPKLNDKSIGLDIDCQLDTLTGDPILLQSLLLNLVDNAIHASVPHSAIILRAYFAEAPVLEVQDSGCGMDAEQVSLVCEPFYRTDKARSRSTGGVGLGLSLCREIARLHKATLKITSEPGNGTIIQVLFTTPLQLSEHSVTRVDVPSGCSAAQVNKKRSN